MSDVLADRSQGFAEAAHLVAGLLAHADDRVPDGLHWRVLPPARTLPAGPIVVRRWFSQISPVERPLATDRAGNGLGDIEPGNDLLILVPPDPATMVGWVQVTGSGDLRVAVVAETRAPNGEEAEITVRDQEPWFVASTDITRIRVSGTGRVDEVVAFETGRMARELGEVLDEASLDPALAEELVAYALPLGGAEPPEDRVLRAAPRLPVPYAPRMPQPGYTENDELDRVLQLVRADRSVVEWLHTAYRARVDGTDGTLTEQVSDTQSISYPATAALGVASADPGVARWLARSGLLRGWADSWTAGEPAMAVALMPVVRLTRIRRRELDIVEQGYDEQLGGGYSELRDRVRQLPPPTGIRGGSWDVDVRVLPLPFVPETTPAIPVAPRLTLPAKPAWLTAGGERNVAADTVAPLRTVGWEQSLGVEGTAHFGPVSLVRVDPERRTLHDVAGDVASPLLLAWPQPAVPGTAPIGVTTLRPREPIASVAAAAGVRWEVRLEDWTGRWGDPAVIDAEPPAPAAPATPSVEAVLVRSAVGGTAPASPGTVRIRVTVARPTAPGALPITAVRLVIDGAAVAVPVPDLSSGSGVATHDHPVPASVPGDRRQIDIAATVTDAAGTASTPPATAVVHADDARAVPPPVVSPRLIVGGRPGPAPDVAVSLTVRAVPGAAYYRFYTAAETGVRSRLGLGGDFRAQPRALRAKALLDAGLPPRDGFTLAATASVDPVSRTATGVLSLPSATSDVVLVRAVPVTGGVDAYGDPAEGVEALVSSVTPAYLVVPSDDVPPLPRVLATSPQPGVVSVRVEVSGVPASATGRMPGPLEARVVEVIDGADPRYWPEVARLPLPAVGGASGSFAGILELDAPTWSRLRLAASVRFAAESTVVPGADVIVAPDLTAAGPQPDAVPAPWGQLSAPSSVDVPGAEPVVRAEPDGAGVRVFVDGLPSVASGSGVFTAIVYTAVASAPLTETARTPVSGEASDFAVAAGPASVVLADPFGVTRPPVVVLAAP